MNKLSRKITSIDAELSYIHLYEHYFFCSPCFLATTEVHGFTITCSYCSASFKMEEHRMVPGNVIEKQRIAILGVMLNFSVPYPDYLACDKTLE
jgi:hypothetical protein